MKSSVPFQVQRDFVDAFVKAVTTKAYAGIAVASVLGDIVNHDVSGFSDLDVLVILNDPPSHDPTNSKNYIDLIDILKTVQEGFDSKHVFFCVFPTFRIEEFMRAFAYMAFKDKYALVHLLVYPSWRAFADWELPSIVESICETGEILLGKKELLEQAKNRTEGLPVERRIRPLLSYLYETYRFLECSRISEKVKRLETFHMLQYVTRYLCGELLRSEGYSMEEAYNWRVIVSEANRLGFSSSTIPKRIYEIRERNQIPLAIELHRLCIECFGLFNEALARFAKREL